MTASVTTLRDPASTSLPEAREHSKHIRCALQCWQVDAQRVVTDDGKDPTNVQGQEPAVPRNTPTAA